MPAPQQAVENQLRTEHHQREQLDRATTISERMAALKHDLALNPHTAQLEAQQEAEQERHLGYEGIRLREMHQQTHEPDIDRGPGLGL
jgi:hypothetical protein